jgi:hypothetical protein
MLRNGFVRIFHSLGEEMRIPWMAFYTLELLNVSFRDKCFSAFKLNHHTSSIFLSYFFSFFIFSFFFCFLGFSRALSFISVC